MTVRSAITYNLNIESLSHELAIASQNYHNFNYKEAFHLFNIAEKYLQEKKFTDAIEQYKKTLEIIKGKEIYEFESYIWSKISFIAFGFLFDKKLSIEAFQNLISTSKDPVAIAGALNSISTIYLTSNNTKFAIEYSKRSIDIIKSINEELIRIEFNAAALLNMGEAFYRDKDYNNSEKYANMALEMFEKIDHKGGQGKAIAQLGLIYCGLQKYEKSKELLYKALDIFIKIDNKEEIAETKSALSVPLAALKNFNSAIKELREAASIHRKIGQLDFATTDLQHAAMIEQIHKQHLEL